MTSGRCAGPALVGVLLIGLASCGGGGGGSGPKPPAQNLVTMLSTPCAGGVGNLPATSCVRLQVEVVGTPKIEVELRVTEPHGGVPYLGSVVLCSGSGGQEFFADAIGGEALIRDLTGVGLRVIDRRWEGGWLNGANSIKQVSERLGELLPWIRANVHQGGPFYGAGNSGGSTELAYALTTWGREDVFDAVVLSGGPTFTRLDYLCQPTSAAWGAQCPSFLPTFQCGPPPCSAPTNNICTGLAGLSAAEQLEDSILHPAADLDFGATATYVLIGLEDCTEWAAQGVLFESQITSPKSLQFLANVGHGIAEQPEGRDAVVQALLGFAPLTSQPPPAHLTHLGYSWTLLEDGEPRAHVERSAIVE